MYSVHWAVIESDGKNHLGWFSQEFSSASDAIAFANAKRAAGARGVCSLDAERNRID